MRAALNAAAAFAPSHTHALALPGGDDVLPAHWSDNFITMLPGETATLTLRTAERVAHVEATPYNDVPPSPAPGA